MLEKPTLSMSDFSRPATSDRLQKVASALEQRGFEAHIARDRDHARDLVLGMIPDGAEVHVALSETMAELGITDAIQGSGHYDAVRPRAMKLDRVKQNSEYRKLLGAPDYVLGSVHAVTEDGILVVGSGSGSQLGPYAAGSGRVILAVGAQKIVGDLAEGLQRVREHSLPLEDARMKAAGYPGSRLSKILIMEFERPGRVTVVLVPDLIGF